MFDSWNVMNWSGPDWAGVLAAGGVALNTAWAAYEAYRRRRDRKDDMLPILEVDVTGQPVEPKGPEVYRAVAVKLRNHGRMPYFLESVGFEKGVIFKGRAKFFTGEVRNDPGVYPFLDLDTLVPLAEPNSQRQVRIGCLENNLTTSPDSSAVGFLLVPANVVHANFYAPAPKDGKKETLKVTIRLSRHHPKRETFKLTQMIDIQ